MAGWDPAFCGSDPVVSCLHDLFQQFQQQEQQLRGSSSDGEAGPSPPGLPPVDPTPLRKALAALPGQQFRVGEWGCTGAGGADRSVHRIFKSCLYTTQPVCAHANMPPTCGCPQYPGEMNDAAEVLLAIYERVSRQRWEVRKSGAADLLR